MRLSGSTKVLSFLLFLSVTIVILAYLIIPKSPIAEILEAEQPKKDDYETLMKELSITEQTCDAPLRIPKLRQPSENDDLLPEAIRKYIQFHREGRRCLLLNYNNSNIEGEVVNETCDVQKVPKIFIWFGDAGLIGGFGDRMISIQNVLMLAILSNRLLLFDWPFANWTPYELSSALLPSYLDWRFPKDVIERYSSSSSDIHSIEVEFKSLNNHGLITNPFSPEYTNSTEDFIKNETDFEKAFEYYHIIHNEFIIMPLNSISDLASNQPAILKNRLTGLTNQPYFTLQRILNNALFRPSKIIQDLTRRRSYAVDEADFSYIAVHMRVGMDVLEGYDDRFNHLQKNDSLVKLSKKFIECVKRSESERLKTVAQHDYFNRVTRIFLATDSLVLKELFIKQAKKNRFMVHTNKRLAWHLDKGRSGLFQNDTDHCIAFLDIFADAYAISNARTVFYVRSNFPEVAMGMGNVIAWHRLSDNLSVPLSEDECYASSLSSVDNPTYGIM